MKALPQIAFDFEAKVSQEPEQPVVRKEEPPINVGFRIKTLKQTQPKEEVVIEEHEPVIIKEELVIETAPVKVEEPLKPKADKPKTTRGRKSIKQSFAEADMIKIPEDVILFQKQYYSMGEVAEMFRVNHSLLRYWENEFDIIQPRKNRKGDRHFRPVDIKNLHLIYHLLRQRKYTIEGAKDFLKKNKKTQERFESIKKLEQIKSFLLEMKVNL